MVKTLVSQSNLGPVVLCDLCNADHTVESAPGGFIFLSKAVCPACAPAFEKQIRKYGEEEYIVNIATPGETFQALVLRHREARSGTRDVISKVYTFDSIEDLLGSDPEAVSHLIRVGILFQCDSPASGHDLHIEHQSEFTASEAELLCAAILRRQEP